MVRVAVLFGINYAKAPCATLQGCVNDAVNVRSALLATGLYKPVDIQMHVDNCEAGCAATTCAGIKAELMRLAARTRGEAIEAAYVHFSGHGCQVADKNRDEADGFDECIVPWDYQRSGVITDDWIADWINRRMNPATKLTMLFDCCHSGTLVENVAPGRKVTFMSGCMDEQTSADAYDIDGCMAFTGALTACLLSATKKSPALWADAPKLKDAVHALLSAKKFEQKPQLIMSSSADKSFL